MHKLDYFELIHTLGTEKYHSGIYTILDDERGKVIINFLCMMQSLYPKASFTLYLCHYTHATIAQWLGSQINK